MHARPGRPGQAGQQSQRGAGAHVVQCDELARVQREFVAQAVRHVTGHEELHLFVGDAPTDVVPALAEIGVGVGDDLGAGRQQIVPVGHAHGVEPGVGVAWSGHGVIIGRQGGKCPAAVRRRGP